ncbi:MAG TPA: carboxypeptidase-like regulatory domain-containing protein [Pyrinomonadaceae bacterium]
MKFRYLGFLVAIVVMSAAFDQRVLLAQDKSTGSIKGKVRVETGTPTGITVLVRRGQTEVARGETGKNGEFLISRLAPGVYGLTFRKPGLSIGTIEDVEVKAGKTRSLGDRLILTIDEGSIAFLSGSVFSADGRSVAGAKVELARLLEDGSAKKIDSRITTETGSFKFRLAPEQAKYRVSVKPANSADAISKDVEIDGAAVYRVALSLPPKQ